MNSGVDAHLDQPARPAQVHKVCPVMDELTTGPRYSLQGTHD